MKNKLHCYTEAIWNEGYKAGIDGLHKEDAPYPYNCRASSKWSVWVDGWEAGQWERYHLLHPEKLISLKCAAKRKNAKSIKRAIKDVIAKNNHKLLTSEVLSLLEKEYDKGSIIHEFREMIYSGEVEIDWNNRAAVMV